MIGYNETEKVETVTFISNEGDNFKIYGYLKDLIIVEPDYDKFVAHITAPLAFALRVNVLDMCKLREQLQKQARDRDIPAKMSEADYDKFAEEE